MTDHDKLLNERNEQRDKLKQGGGAARIEAQHAKGKRTAREKATASLCRGCGW